MRLISRKKTETLEIDEFSTPVRIRSGQILTDVLTFNFDRFINYPSANFRRHVERVIRELWNDALAVSPLFLCLIWKYIDESYLQGDEKGIWDHCPVPTRNARFPGKAFVAFFDKYSTVKYMDNINLQLFVLMFNQCMARLQIMQSRLRQATDICLNENNENFIGTSYTAPQRYALYSQFYGDDEVIAAAKNYGWCNAEQSDLICEKKRNPTLSNRPPCNGETPSPTTLSEDNSEKIVVESFSEFVRLSEIPEVKIAVCHTVDNIIGLCCAQFSQLVRNDMNLPQQLSAEQQNVQFSHNLQQQTVQLTKHEEQKEQKEQMKQGDQLISQNTQTTIQPQQHAAINDNIIPFPSNTSKTSSTKRISQGAAISMSTPITEHSIVSNHFRSPPNIIRCKPDTATYRFNFIDFMDKDFLQQNPCITPRSFDFY